MKKSNLSIGDTLAIERTKLACERTFLAYFRTTMVLVSTGLSILSIDIFKDMRLWGGILTALSPLVLLFGVYRIFNIRKDIKATYKNR